MLAVERSERVERHSEVGVAVQHEESGVLHERQRLDERAASAQRVVLDRIRNGAAAILVAEVAADRVVHITDREHRAAHALPDPVVEQALEERPAADRSHRLRHVADRGAQPRAQTAGENDGLHGLQAVRLVNHDPATRHFEVERNVDELR